MCTTQYHITFPVFFTCALTIIRELGLYYFISTHKIHLVHGLSKGGVLLLELEKVLSVLDNRLVNKRKIGQIDELGEMLINERLVKKKILFVSNNRLVNKREVGEIVMNSFIEHKVK